MLYEVITELAKAEADYAAAKTLATTAKAEYDAANDTKTSTSTIYSDLSAEADALEASYKLQEDLYNTVDGSIDGIKLTITKNETDIANAVAANVTATQTIKDKQEELAAGVQTKAEFAKQITDKERNNFV